MLIDSNKMAEVAARNARTTKVLVYFIVVF